MKALSTLLSENLIFHLKELIKKGDLEGIEFQQAMQFLLTDGVLPEDGLPLLPFLKLENWARSFHESQMEVSFTTTELKNKTGLILEEVNRGKTVKLFRHGRPIAQMKKIP